MSWSRFGTISSSLNFLVPSHAAQSPADNGFVVAHRHERLHVKQLDASGLQHRGPVSWAVVGRKNKRLQRRHLTGVESALKLRGFPFLVCAIDFSALDSFAQLLLNRSQKSCAWFCYLPVLLIIVQPERGINANEHQNQFGNPAAEARETRTFFSCLTHDLRGKLNQ